MDRHLEHTYQSQHITVLLKEAVEYLNCQSGQHYLDFTFGGGGHSEAILKQTAPLGIVDAFDKDAQAIASYNNDALLGKRLFIHHQTMSQVPHWLDQQQSWSKYSGALIDCGVSSFQLDHPGRGFSYMHDGPLDMRMDNQSGMTAKQLILKSSEQDLKRIIKDYGEENFAGRIARTIKERQAQLISTQDLVDCIVRAIPDFVKGKKKQAVLSRVFQAIRIAVNEEMREIELVLGHLCENLKAMARIVVITFHSIEDRLVKQLFKEKEKHGYVKRINKKVIVPSEEEIAFNPRSRSAKMRVVECLGGAVS
ncbi:MAG TPA: 16S rRNA (cytosine(1402)-N(4))-methyltransferase RsmH [Oligoflexia bacterium]|nr:16S rRNA (cytosine(1402)-N(4))-methyltransferase RsmH [Oligoflexia bacterium]HMR24519.1 16S rRNA (cytosine(1402)-N(4))-methyltransferase RsmH [Oligoflexia bacterium]